MSALRSLWGAFRPRQRAPALILMYHRIATADVDPWHLCVSPESFDIQLTWLSRHCRVASVRQLVLELQTGQVPERTVAITFDDGYADNFITGKPLLSKHGLPATFFLTSGALGSAREFWWDELERLLLRPQALPPVLELSLAGQARTFAGRKAAEAYDPRQSAGVRPWEAAADSRLGLFYAVWNFLRPFEEPVRQVGLAALRSQLGVAESLRQTHRMLTPDEARRLGEGPGIDIGAHSVTHSSFAYLSAEQQRWEMQQSKKDLEVLIGRPIAGFAYPYGDHVAASAPLAAEAGFEFACTTEGKRITRDTSPYLLPRLAVTDSTEWAFAWRVRRVVG